MRRSAPSVFKAETIPDSVTTPEAEGEGLEPPCADLQRTSRFRNEGNTILPAFLGCREGQSPSEAESRGFEPLHPFQDGNRLPSGRFTDSANSPKG